MIMTIAKQLYQLANPKIAKHSQQFFKTKEGEYGEGDKFLGIRVPELRKIAKKNINQAITKISELLKSKYHEIRLTGLLILVYKFQKADNKEQKEIFNFYLKNLKSVNNWDLVDTTTPQIIGKYLLSNPNENRKFLYTLAKSKNLWERRIAIMTTHAFIRDGQFNDTLELAKKLLKDKHDLIHKAVGWMLREVGKKDEKILVQFLSIYSTSMPRIMLRYAIERLPEKLRQFYLYH